MEDLSEDILLNIMSKLSIGDVVNFSLVRKQWYKLSISLNRIVIKMDEGCPESSESFVSWVNQFMKFYASMRSKEELPITLRSFEVYLCFTKHYSSNIDTWITIAISNGLRSLCIRPVCAVHFESFARDDEKYYFPWRKVNNLPIALQRLNLRGCIFKCCLTSQWISLRFLDLLDSTITEDDMEIISLCFPNLRRLLLFHCKVPAKLIVTNGTLPYVIIWFCPELKQIDLFEAKGLIEFSYRGGHVEFDLSNSLMLTKIKIGFIDVHGVEYAFKNLPTDTVRSLSIFQEWELPQVVSKFHSNMYQSIHFYVSI